MLSAPSRLGGLFDAPVFERLVGFKVVGPLSITSGDTEHLPRMRSVGTDAPNALGFLANQTHPIIRGDPFALSSTELGIVDVTCISLRLGCIVESLPIFGTRRDSVGAG